MLKIKTNYDIGKEISAIINVDGEKMTDGECIDAIIEYLKNNNIYWDVEELKITNE